MATVFVAKLWTVQSLLQIGDFRLRSVSEYDANGRLVFEGVYVNDRALESRPFRIHVDYGADLKQLKPLIRARINANESLLDVILSV